MSSNIDLAAVKWDDADYGMGASMAMPESGASISDDSIDLSGVKWDDDIEVEPEPIEKPKPIPVEQPSFMKEVVGGTAKELGKQLVGTGEAAMSLASGALLWPFSKAYGAMALPWGKEAAKMAEESIASLGYSPQTKEGQAAMELVGKGFDKFLLPAKMAEKETEKYSPRASYLVGLGAELAEFALTGGLARGVKAKMTKPAVKAPTEAPPLDATFAKGEILDRMVADKEAARVKPESARPLDVLRQREVELSNKEIPEGQFAAEGPRAARQQSLEEAFTKIPSKEDVLRRDVRPRESEPIIIDGKPTEVTWDGAVYGDVEVTLRKGTEQVGGTYGIRERPIPDMVDTAPREYGNKLGGERDAKGLREVEGQVQGRGDVGQGREAESRQDLQLEASEQAGYRKPQEEIARSGGEVLESTPGTPQVGVKESLIGEPTETPDYAPTAFERLRGRLTGEKGRAVEEVAKPPETPGETAGIAREPMAPKAEGKAKEPWEMKWDNYLEAEKERQGYYNMSPQRQDQWNNSGTGIKKVEQQYYDSIENALKEGKDVPFENKPAWALTAQDAARQTDDIIDIKWHKGVVKDAIEDGKPVPQSIIDDYPDLKPPASVPGEGMEALKPEVGGKVKTAEELYQTRRDALQRLGEVRDTKPRGELKRFGTNGPTPEQKVAYDAEMKAWNKQDREANKAFKAADAAETGKRTAKTILSDVNAILGEKGSLSLAKENLSPEQQAAYVRLSKDIQTIRANAQRAGKSVEDYLKDLRFDPKVSALLGRKSEEIQKYAGSVNLEKQNIPDEYKQLETDIASGRPKEIQTWDKTGQLRDKILSDYGEQSKTLKKLSGIKNLTEQIDAARQINVNAIDTLAKIAQTGNKETFAKEFENYKKVFETTNDASSEIGRALNIHKRTVSVNHLASAFGKLKRTLNDREFQEFKEINYDNPVSVNQFLNRLGNPKVKDYFIEYWYNMILSGPPTHLVNTISNTGWLAFQVPHKALVSGVDAVYSKLTGAERTRYFNEILPTLAGYKSGFKKGMKPAGQILKTGKANAFDTKWELEAGQATEAFARSPNATLRKIAPAVSGVSRALRAMDVWAKSIAYDGEARSIARAESNRKGLKAGKERDAFERKYAEKLPEEAHERAMKAADYGTFTDTPDPFTQWVLGVRKVPFVGTVSQFVVPFVNTIGNLTKRGIEMTPGLGVVKEAVSRHMGRGQSNPEIIAKQVEGSIIALYIFSKIADGDITGSLPKSESERDAFYREGKLPWSIRFGDTWYSYRRMEPFNTVIASAAVGYEKILNAKDDKTPSAVFFDVANGIKDNLLDSSYFQGVQQVFNRYGRAEGSVSRWGASWAPYSSFWRSVHRAYEAATEGGAKVKETEKTLSGELLGALSQTIPPGLLPDQANKLNVWGKEITLPGGVFRQWLPYKWSPETDDKVEKELARLNKSFTEKGEAGLYPGMPGRSITMGNKKIKLNDKMYRNYVMSYGSIAKNNLEQAMSTEYWDKYSDEQKMKIFDKRLKSANRMARGKLMQMLRLDEKLNEAIE